MNHIDQAFLNSLRSDLIVLLFLFVCLVHFLCVKQTKLKNKNKQTKKDQIGAQH